MASEKDKENYQDKSEDAPPAYTTPSEPVGPSISSGPSAVAISPSSSDPQVPTVNRPFTFPTDPPPSYANQALSSQPSATHLIAIPQSSASSSAPFVTAYPPSLLARGIPRASWLSFLSTVSAFLTATVSDRALAHAADVGKHMGDRPTSFAKGIVSHVKDVGRGIGKDAKSGNVIGAAFKVIGGAISIPVRTAIGGAAVAVSLPGTTVAAAVKKPQTPRERANAYLAVANNDWFGKRGLHAEILNSLELSRVVGASVTSIASASLESNKGNAGAATQLASLQQWIAELEVEDKEATLKVADETLWLVVRHVVIEADDSATAGPGKGKQPQQ